MAKWKSEDKKARSQKVLWLRPRVPDPLVIESEATEHKKHILLPQNVPIRTIDCLVSTAKARLD